VGCGQRASLSDDPAGDRQHADKDGHVSGVAIGAERVEEEVGEEAAGQHEAAEASERGRSVPYVRLIYQ